MLYLINTLIGFGLSIVIDARARDKFSDASPYSFNKSFWIKDNALRLALSLLIMGAIVLNTVEVTEIFEKDFKFYDFIYLLVGFAPDYIIAYCKRKFGFLQPKEVEGFERK